MEKKEGLSAKLLPGNNAMKKTLYTSIFAIWLIPLLAYAAIQAIYPCDPDIVHVKRPSLFAAEWRKVSYSDNFSEYINPSKLEKNLDQTVDIVTMRNYFHPQSDSDLNDGATYKSHVSYETVDCFNQTIIVNKTYLLADHFARGPLVDDPIEPVSRPIKVVPYSIGLTKVMEVCKLAGVQTDSSYIKSNFMNNI